MAGGPRVGSGDQARRRLAAGYFIAALLIAATIAAVVVALTSGGSESDSTSISRDGFAPVYEGLDERRIDAGVPTMAEGGGEHLHPQLELYARGEQLEVPANIGIDPAQPPAMMAGLHTHDTSGTIHNEAGTGATLGDFFAVWGIPFSRTELGPYEATANEKVMMWVDDAPSDAYGELELADGQHIVVAIGGPDDIPPSVSAP